MMKLLLIDDDAFLRDMYVTKFTEKGYKVEAVDSGATGLRALENSQDFNAILIDMILPGMSGVDFMKTVREEHPDLKAKFIVLSNQGMSDNIKEATDAGAVGYIIKAEAIPSDVIKKVEELINK